jgi:hypothetical protein
MSFLREQFDKLALMTALLVFAFMAAHASKYGNESLVRFASVEADHLVGALLLVLTGRSAANRGNGSSSAPAANGNPPAQPPSVPLSGAKP